MKFDFDKIVNRRNTDSLKWDYAAEKGLPADVLPLWVADMDFPAPPKVLEDVHKVVEHGIFGYTEPKSGYYDAIISWFKTRHGFDFQRRDIVKVPGVVYALAMAIQAFTKSGSAVIIQTPVYYPFYEVIKDNGRKLVTNPLVYKNSRYTIDFDDFERKIAENNVQMFILCNPHNPVGRVWSLDELEKLNQICKNYGVIVISDEIHCDLVFKPNKHIPFGTIDENTVVATAPSKTFNLAGLQNANIIVKNTELRKKLQDSIAASGYSQLNSAGLAACQSAYSHGGEWLDELLIYLHNNYLFARRFIGKNLPQVEAVPLEGTYLLWLDFKAFNLSQDELDEIIIKKSRLWLDKGTMFGREGEGFQRINIACPRIVLSECLTRISAAFTRNA